MANPRPEEKPTQSPEDTIRRAGERTAEQTRRIGLATAEAGEEVAQASGHLLRQNTEMLQNAWRFGFDMAAAMMGRSTDQLGRTFGLTGNEAQQAAERSVRNAEAIIYSTTAVAKGMNGASREYFDFVRQQIERTMDRTNELWNCRTPHDLAAVQTDLMRDTIRSALDTSRRMADLSLKVADDAGNHITRSIERMRQAA
ncbi:MULTISPECIES: phasin family protein [Bradyrhizobium]|uniref:phasin family protein n=1 Tax=Bradyrhizobium TaxID=374 RepID=UPI00155E0E1C|nr:MULTISPECIES: phasin family protein [Bradyrhizobium]MDD1518549.1 Phasin protein [Bradyrhizobium sp. WBAH30]MDD1542347.1 Phasin protein [Bradyrhizobium sp. WBAH41]MDD1556499.1 Phasin protein [Bradyrhizobium sp. WBAH23]MDD1561660.1 Phasin protein [Bradyrhizobium sp. WBAH33]MDD1589318.1 Phasin protein [Bradyrhizobium sp. WBAH42]